MKQSRSKTTPRKGGKVLLGIEVVLTGGVAPDQHGFAAEVKRLLHKRWPRASVRLLPREGAWGAVRPAQELQDQAPSTTPAPSPMPPPVAATSAMRTGESLIPEPLGPPPTEQRHPLSRNLHKMSLPAAIRLMLAEDAGIPAALIKQQGRIARAVEIIVRSFRGGGRLFYVGAGTSGRLGALDAYECPPTFSVPQEMVQAIVAGGDQAMSGAVEDAEDDLAAGDRAVRSRGICSRDVVVGIAASGRTPFVWGALHAARELGAATILVCLNPNLSFRREIRPTLVIAPAIGPEILTGSTRLKAGTATKLILNMFTTLAMVRLGKVIENLMVDVRPTNSKLRDRAARIVHELTGASLPAARDALQRHSWSVRKALASLNRGRSVSRSRLRSRSLRRR